MSVEYKTISGGPAPEHSEPPFPEYAGHIAAQLTRCAGEGWRLIHTASHTPLDVNQHREPTFFCLLERDSEEDRDVKQDL